ncbi:MAG: DUF480 domain-containing protein [Steroidobacteraceae bacterium]
MNILLNANEARVIGCLIEKALTTPDQYPLSLNALTNACNQKSNRDPLLDLSERTVQETVDALVAKHLMLERSGFGSRVPKYQHRFCNTGFGTLEFNPVETGILCELLLRGPQTPGELRTRISRMAEVADVHVVEAALEKLSTRDDGPFVVRLPREPSRRDSRYAHLFSGPIDVTAMPEESHSSHGSNAQRVDRIERLEVLVADLRKEVEELKAMLGGVP